MVLQRKENKQIAGLQKVEYNVATMDPLVDLSTSRAIFIVKFWHHEITYQVT